MAEKHWKTVARRCGRSLNRGVLEALVQMDVNNFSSIEAFRIRHRILSALPDTMEYSERVSLAWDLAVVWKYGTSTFNSVMICFGTKPFKIRCRMPNLPTISAEAARKYMSSSLPTIAYGGNFVQLRQLLDVFIYVYSFTETVSCSDIQDHHYDLPVPVVSRNPISSAEMLTRKSQLGAGNAYLHMDEKATSIEYTASGHCKMSFLLDGETDEGSEDSRTEYLKDYLQKILPVKYTNVKVNKVEVVRKKKNANFCNFTGGGDLKISQVGFVFVLMTDGDTEYGGSSPIDPSETLDIECKASASKTNQDVKLQLQADMYNILVREYIDKLEKAQTNEQFVSLVETTNKLTVYGMSIGIDRPVEVLKLTVNFAENELEYQQKFHRYSSLPKEPLIDSCIAAVLERISKKSPSPPIDE